MIQPEKRTSVRTYIEITREASDALDRLIASSGQKQVTLLSRILEWFASEDKRFQRAVANQEDGAATLLALKMSEMIAAGRANPGIIESVEDATRIIRLMSDRIDQINKAVKQQISKAGRANLKKVNQ